MPRNRRPTGDDATNARKRYTRQAARYLKNADNATSEHQRSRYMTLAKDATERALKTYNKPTPIEKMRKDLQEVVMRTGVQPIEAPLEILQDDARRAAFEKRMQMLRKQYIDDKTSKKFLKIKDKDERREAEANAIMNTHVGSRIIGSLSEIWQDAIIEDEDGNTHIDHQRMEELIFDYLGVDNWMDAIEMFEQIYGDDLYVEPDNTMKYDDIVASAQEKIEAIKRAVENGEIEV